LKDKSAVIGTLRHELFQICLSNSDFSYESAQRFAKDIVRRNAEQLLAASLTDGEAIKHILQSLPELQKFQSTYLCLEEQNKKGASHIQGASYGRDAWIKFDKLHQLEESVLSPEFGLKGSIDVTMLASFGNASSCAQYPPSIVGIEFKTGHKQSVQPSHVAQLNLYTLMLRAKYGTARQSPYCASAGQAMESGAAIGGVLLYLNDKGHALYNVSPSLGEIKSLIGQRNILAAQTKFATTIDIQDVDHAENKLSFVSGSKLPDVMQSPRPCSYCFSNSYCMMYAHSDIELSTRFQKGTKFTANCVAVSESHAHLLKHFAGHLNQEEISYFRAWDQMIDLEFKSSKAQLLRAWRQPSMELEMKNRTTISNMAWDALYKGPENFEDGRSLLKFSRISAGLSQTRIDILNFEVGDTVVISSEESMKRLSGVQNDIIRGQVHVMTDRNIYIKVMLQDVTQIQRFCENWKKSNSSEHKMKTPAFRFDKDEYTSGASILRQNLMNLFVGGIPQYSVDQKKIQTQETDDPVNTRQRQRLLSLRDSVINSACEPRFDATIEQRMFASVGGSISIPGCDLMDLCIEFYDLNKDQQNAVVKVKIVIVCTFFYNATHCLHVINFLKVMSSLDFSVIQGMPGTGKTHTITFIARLLAARGMKVLVTSYTHNAVDTIMTKLISAGVGIKPDGSHTGQLVRIGQSNKCMPIVHDILASRLALDSEQKATGDTSITEACSDFIRQVMAKSRIVGVSTLTVPRSSLLIEEHFDVVIVDEAGQMTQPACLGPLMAADKFVLVGDHMQLPPVVKNPLARKAGKFETIKTI